MSSPLVIWLVILSGLNLALAVVLLCRRHRVDIAPLRLHVDSMLSETRRLEQSFRDEFSRLREETNRNAGALREEVCGRMTGGLDSLLQQQSIAQRSTEEKVESFRGTLEGRLREFGDASETRLSRLRQEINDNSTQTREMLGQQFERIRVTVDSKLQELQAKNEQKLDEMRRTVDEKLEGTLERRLGESFKLVSERLEQVHRGLGEMQAMASNVGDLKRVLTNVKVRGTWGEVQLGFLLEQMLTPEQYSANVAVRPDSDERVEFAIRLPGAKGDAPVWLPIDAKFPQEDYQRLCEASERADADGAATAGKALESQLRAQAKNIHDKYIAPPHTTDFAILFLASEGLYAEVLRRPGLADGLQRDCRIVLAGPSTLAALLNSLQMGFRTLAIQERSSEVWKVLGAVKTEFGRFGEVIAKVKKKLEEASSQIEQTEVRTRAIGRKLRDVEALPAEQATQLLSDALVADNEEGEGETPETVDLSNIAVTQGRLGV